MKSILKSGIIISLLFTCMQVNAQANHKKPVNKITMHDSQGDLKTKTKTTGKNGFTDGTMDLLKGKTNTKTIQTKTKTGKNGLVNNENAVEIHPVTSIKKPNTYTGQTHVNTGKTPVKTNTKTSSTKTIKHS